MTATLASPMNNHHLLQASSMANGDQPLSESQVKVAAAPSGFDLLVAASKVKSKPAAKAEGESASNKDEDEAPSTAFNDEKKPTNDALNCKDDKHFPQVLQEILETPEYQSIVHWLPDGLSFIISDKQRFSDEIIPKHFRRVAKFDSFIRKLSRYGFRRVKNPRKGEESSFAHIDFVRGKPCLCSKMKSNSKAKPTGHEVLPASAKQNGHVQVASTLHDAATIRDREKSRLCSKPTYQEARQNANVQVAHCNYKATYQQAPYTNQMTHAQLANIHDNAALLPSTKVPQSFLTAGNMLDASRINVPSIDASRINTPSTSLLTGRNAIPMAAVTIDPLVTAAAVAAATATQERHLLASLIPRHPQPRPQQRIFSNSQILMLQRHHERQVQLQRLLQISAINDQQLLTYQRRPQADIAANERAAYEEPNKKRRRKEDK